MDADADIFGDNADSLSSQALRSVAIAAEANEVPANDVRVDDNLPAAIVDPLDDLANYVDQTDWFESIQDDGKPIEELCNDDELRVFQRDKKKSKAKYVRFGDHMYQKIWFLARDVYKLWNGRKEEAFPKLPKNATDGLRAIAERILTDRVTKGPGDIHSVVTDSAQIALS